MLRKAEAWRAVPGFEQFYEVSDQGRVRSLDRLVKSGTSDKHPHRGRVLSPRIRLDTGHLYVTLSREGKTFSRSVHRLMALAFMGGDQGPGVFACHVNGVSGDNRVENLYWASPKENAQDAVRHGTHRNTRKTHCKHGHEFDEENTVTYGDGRQCRACFRRRSREYKERVAS